MFATFKGVGNSLYFLTGVEAVFAKTITIGVDVDYTWIRIGRGKTRETNIPEGTDFSWSNGVNVWSDQLSLTAHASYAF